MIRVKSLDQIIKFLKEGKIGVMPTDTIYGIVGSALNPETVEKIYTLRKRSKNKPFIILISSINDLKKFDIKLSKEQEVFLQKIWPNPVSVVLHNLAFRMPKNKKLLALLREVGPLVAPSANIEGEPPAQNIDEAKKYFGNRVDFYLDGGKIESSPSTLIKLASDGLYHILRQGAFQKFPKDL
ncbi:TPA: threonylcarbamoyl-AMP synthase [Candidatus Daviesbacteria bacterium]|nr:MAG: Sua5/YciO/YrdC/YwlC family protein [Candidatus Daviesbacteria bacterium GW2011_GWA2_38_17]OGE44420.1 MAG: threonylcarbamoyl-AMP synthase [Candidatus Daviesbacteria bacterium RIFCSPHIGHO2_12_FULL_38_25]OGE68187.1 MAG: threonylcarbamoyl-AMP synthase [Candidatus Daviesbacteria bacterium RIFCSPLOWO2_02_FULL_38_18]OGE72375.1 MAG: threonylcarbamoyl-AMP synthase [Candidatus Daviesbacteria bacterium RIFCSPLOWO2_12_FULL_38_10]HBQ50940.1 threonylcarbamoyl-AMP synthase [Candidatus Daviesbacteria b